MHRLAFIAAPLAAASALAQPCQPHWEAPIPGIQSNFIDWIQPAHTPIGHVLYVGGAFATIGGLTTNSVAMWDGSAWRPLGAGCTQNGFPGHIQIMSLFDSGSGTQFQQLEDTPNSSIDR